jgi:hypothetical protein
MQKVKPMKKHIQVKSFYLRFYGIADKTYFSRSRKNLTPPKNDSDQEKWSGFIFWGQFDLTGVK